MLLSDPELTAIQAYDVWKEKKLYGKTSMGVVRTTYVIGPDGVIEWAFLLLSDPELTAIQAYDVWKEKKLYGKTSMGVVRTTYVIGPDGVIEWAGEKVKPDQNAQQILDFLTGK